MGHFPLADNIYNDPALEPIRAGFGRGLKVAGEQNEAIVALCADLTESTQMHLFRDAFPKRFVEIGVAEQNLVTVARFRRQILHAYGNYAYRSGYELGRPRTLVSMFCHIIHGTMETLHNPLPVFVLGRGQVGIGDADLAETELFAPMLDISRQGRPVAGLIGKYCGFTHGH